jgi:polyferredoxin
MKNKFYRIRVVVAVIIGVLSVLALVGVCYPVKIFDVQFGALIAKLFAGFSPAALVLLGALLIITLLFGRIYCSTICPMGLAQEFVGIFKKKTSGQQKNLWYKYIIAAIFFGMLVGGTAYYYRMAEPYTYFGAMLTLGCASILAFLVLALVIFKDRFFCTNICPIGTVLGLIAKCSLNKIYIKNTCISCGACERACPSGCINFKEKKVINETCVKCLKCLNVCPNGSVGYGKTAYEKAPFSAKRRAIILGVSTAAVFGAAAKTGSVIKKALNKKFSDVILPPGAISEERFLNACLNCNLCVKVCPERVIKKADSKYCAVQLDYSKNYCRFECNKCNEVCPAGALKKISLEEKQKLRLAMIEPPLEVFDGFEKCVNICPTKALRLNDGKPVFEPLLCVGCGACVATSGGRIKIYAAAQQKRI